MDAKTDFAVANLPFHLMKNKQKGHFGQKSTIFGQFYLQIARRRKSLFLRIFAPP